jgi:hypothetical protein
MCAVSARTGSISTTVTRPPSPEAERAQPADACRRLLADAPQPLVDLRSVLCGPACQFEAVVDHDLRRGLRDGEQVRRELVGRNPAPRKDRHTALDQRRGHGVLRRKGIRPGGNHLCARFPLGEHAASGLRLEVHNDRNTPTAECSVRKPLDQQPSNHRHVLPGPLDPPMTFRRQPDIRDPRHVAEDTSSRPTWRARHPRACINTIPSESSCSARQRGADSLGRYTCRARARAGRGSSVGRAHG